VRVLEGDGEIVPDEDMGSFDGVADIVAEEDNDGVMTWVPDSDVVAEGVEVALADTDCVADGVSEIVEAWLGEGVWVGEAICVELGLCVLLGATVRVCDGLFVPTWETEPVGDTVPLRLDDWVIEGEIVWLGEARWDVLCVWLAVWVTVELEVWLGDARWEMLWVCDVDWLGDEVCVRDGVKKALSE
jgi:hypothetical protein